MSSSSNLKSLIYHNKQKLLDHKIINAEKEIVWYLQKFFSISLYNIKINHTFQLTDNEIKQFKSFVNRRINGEPFQYILGLAPFYGYDFIVNQHTLIPRPETETIIEIVKLYDAFDNALDIGTGAGNLAITLSLEKIAKTIDAIDISSEALKVAKANCYKHKTSNVLLSKKNIFNSLGTSSYDLIISNPPYISKEEFISLNREVKNYEPKIALTDNEDGLKYFKFFAKNLTTILNPSGKIILEVGREKMCNQIQRLFSKENYHYKWHKDLNGDMRVIEIYR